MDIIVLALVGLGLPLSYTLGPRWVSYYLKMFVFYLSLLVVSSIVVPFLLFRRSSVENMIFPSKMMIVISHILGLHYTVVGLDKLKSLSDESAVIVANHQFSLDLFGLFTLWPICKKLTIVSKASLKYMGPFGLTAIKSDIIFIDRQRAKEANDIIQAALEDCKKNGVKILIFPEGTRNLNLESKEMLPFKLGAFKAAIGAQVPIIPIVYSHYNFLDPKQKIFEPSSVQLQVLDPITTKGLTCNDAESLANAVRDQMLKVFRGEDLAIASTSTES